MATAAPSLAEYLATETAAFATACTACGKCVEVCPVVPSIEQHGETPGPVTHSVRGMLAGRAPSPGAAEWVHACNGCGECIPACPEGINPRKMLVLVSTLRAREEGQTPELFRKMSRAIRLVAGMQLVPAEFARLLTPSRTREAPVLFYVGCNPIRTPHLLFNTMFVLDAIGIDYEVVGGPGACCGIIQQKWEGELAAGERVTAGTLRRFEGFKPERVLTWCPSCQIHLGESLAGFRQTSFDLDHVTDFLVAHEMRLRATFVHPVAKRVVLHAHIGLTEIGRNVARLLAAIPGLTLLDTVWESGYACGGSGCNRAPRLAAREHARLLDRVRDTGADVLVTLYHGCHVAFVRTEKDHGARVLSFTDLLVEALGGVPHEDRLRRYLLADDLRMVVEEGLPYLRANGIDVAPDFLERILPELFALAEFRGGLQCFGSPTRAPDTTAGRAHPGGRG